MTGTIFNAAAIIVGGVLGTALRRGVPRGIQQTLMQGLALAVILIGFSYAIKTEEILILILSLVVGGILGELAAIEDKLARLGQAVERRFGGDQGVARAFVTASLVYCVGAMAVMGALQDGLTGNPEILVAKGLIDGVLAMVFASTMGYGVALSALPVFIYQGCIALLAHQLSPLLTPALVAEMTAVGGLLIVGIGANLLELTRIRAGNLLPAIFVVPVLIWLKSLL